MEFTFTNLEIAFISVLLLSILPLIHQILLILLFQCFVDKKTEKRLH
jgi:hypothetical protein